MQEQVIVTALRLLNEVGLASLSMRRIASEIGVQPSALYWHFPNKQTILAALADRLLTENLRNSDEEQDDPQTDSVGSRTARDPKSWKPTLQQEMFRLRTALLGHRDGAELVSTVAAFGLGSKLPEQRIRLILDQIPGLTNAKKTAAIAALVHFTYGHTQALQQRENAIHFGAEIQGHNDVSVVRARSANEFSEAVSMIINGIVEQ